jgi:hypothetical protein
MKFSDLSLSPSLLNFSACCQVKVQRLGLIDEEFDLLLVTWYELPLLTHRNDEFLT